MAKISLVFYPNDAKKSKQSNRVPLYLRIRKNREKCEIRLNWDISSQDRKLWNDTLQRLEKKGSTTNVFIEKIERQFELIKIEHFQELDELDIHNLKYVLSGQSSNDKDIPSIIDYAEQYYEKNIAKNKKFTPGTQKNYKKAINHLKQFCLLEKRTQTKIVRLNFSFAQEFANYLMSDSPEIEKKAMTEASACGNIKKFRTIFKQAINEKYISENPFTQISLSYQSPRKPKLSPSQLSKFFDITRLPKHDQISAHIFLFMALTGTAYLDCMRLTINNLEYTQQGVKLTYNRIKTGHESSQYLSEQALHLLEVFDKMPDVQNSEFLLPQRSNQYLNRSLKLIAKQFGIPFPLTSHIGRHTFRSLLDEADVVDPTVISKLMGWSTRNSMDAIYRDVTNRRLIKTKQQLDDFINLTFFNKSC